MASSGCEQTSPLSADGCNTCLTVYRFVDSPSYGTQDNIDLIRFNKYYRYYALFVDPRDARAYIKDPLYLVFSVEINALVFWFRFFSLRDLQYLSKAHGFNPGKATKVELCEELYRHICLRRCSRLVYVFKSLPTARRAVNKAFNVQGVLTDRVSSTVGSESGPATPNDQGEVTLPAEAVRQDMVSDTCHLDPLDEAKKMAVMQEWREEISTEKLQMAVCAVCSIRTFRSNAEWIDSNGVDLSLLGNRYLPEEILPKSYDLSVYQRAVLNVKGLECKDRLGRMLVCKECKRSLESSVVPKFALGNWLYYGYEALPTQVRADLEQSTLFDKMLIARARCNTVTCRFNAREEEEGVSASGKILSNARKGVRGNVMVAPLDVVRMNRVIPPSSDSIRDTMCAVFVGNIIPTRSSIRKYSPVLVRKSRVKRMIQFLLCNNRHYKPSAEFDFSSENLDNLFVGQEDEGVPSSVHLGYIPSNDAIDSAVADYTPRNVDNDEEADELLMENVGYTDGDDSPMSYDIMKTIALERCLQGKPFVVSGKGPKAVPDFHNPSILTWLFPHLDPWGIGGFHHPARRTKITMQEQISHLLMVDDSPFERDPEFAFVFYNVCRKAVVSQSLRFTVSRRLHRDVIRDLLSVDPEVLTELNREYSRNPYYRPVDDKEKQAIRLLASLRMIAKHVPGSDGYKTMLRNEIRALINFRGAPTLFVTINPSDVDHPLVRLLSGHDINLEDVSRGEDMSEWKRKLFAARNPSACARFFDLFISKFISCILRYGREDCGVYGRCVAYYGTVEAQGKGTLHCHMLIWLKGHLSPQELRDEMSRSDDYQAKVFAWLESIIKCEFPGAPDIESQKKSYPRRILHKEAGDPHPGLVPLPSPSRLHVSRRSFWREFDDLLIRLLHHYSWHVHQATCWKYLERGQAKTDENCRMGIDGETRQLTELDPETKGILLRRHHPKIAPYTDVVSVLMQCNMDIKFVGSGEAAKAFLYYVTDYITKASLPVHVGMSALAYAVKKASDRIPNGIDNCSDQQALGAVITAVNSMMGKQEISHPQVMSYLVGGGDHYTSEKFAVLNWGMIRRFVQVGYDGHTPGLGLDDDFVSLTFGNKSITASDQQLDYMYRGHDAKFAYLCLYDFVGRTSKVRFGRGIEPCIENPACFTSDKHPQRYTHYLSVRHQDRVPVLLGPSIPNPARSPENKEEWARDMLILFKPWRRLSDIRGASGSWLEAFEAFEGELSESHRKIIKNMHVLTECSEARDNHRKGRHATDQFMDEEHNISLRDVDGQEHIVDLTEIYQHDPFQELEDSGVIELGDILSDDASRLLDMCLPLDVDEFTSAVGEDDVHPTRVSIDDERRLAYHSAVMTQKRKRLFREEREDEDGNGILDAGVGPSRKRSRTDAPLAMRATLRSAPDIQAMRENERLIAEEIVSEMGIGHNREQLKAFSLVAEHVIEYSEEQLLMHVSGVGGTGKSHLIKSIVMLFERLQRRKELLLGAPTGIAAVLIGGQTLHSLILVTPNGKSRNMAPLTKIWKDVKYLIVDEVSMVGARFMSQLSSRIRQGKGDDIQNSGKPFGGVNVIFMGDLGQLKPPKQYALFANELVKNPSFEEARNERGISGLNGAFLWRQVSTVVELVKNQRHQDDPLYAAFLSRLRLGECRTDGETAPGPSDLEYLRTRLIENQASDPTVMTAFRDAPIIVGSKRLRDLLNVKLVKYHARRLGRDLNIYHSRDYASKTLLSGQIQKRLWSLPSSINRDALGRLPLFIGMKVMITENLAFDHGVVNGSEGTVEDIKFEEDEEGRRYASVVYVKILGSGLHLEGLEQDMVPIFPVATRIEYQALTTTQIKAKSFTRKQLPLVPAYVYTDFKGQGRTLTRVIVDLATARGQGVYVMLSRVKSLSGLLILRWFPPNKVYHRLPEELRYELRRLHEIGVDSIN